MYNETNDLGHVDYPLHDDQPDVMIVKSEGEDPESQYLGNGFYRAVETTHGYDRRMRMHVTLFAFGLLIGMVVSVFIFGGHK